MIDKMFKNSNLKITKQRKEIIDIILELKNSATISNIIKKASMNKSTVYRIIDILVKNNILVKQINYDNNDYYVINEYHKHYIKCIKCNKIKELDNCPFDSINISGFEVINHSLKIEGICEDCKER